MSDSAGVLETARRIADDVLFARALETDASELLPRDNVDALADAGLYGTAGPEDAGGLGIDLPTGMRVIETLASGCLTTAFVWIQHHGLVFRLSQLGESSPLREEWLPKLCRGEQRAGVVLAGARPGPPLLTATRARGGWTLNGDAPWVTGWGRVDVLMVAARDGEDVVWAILDAGESDGIGVEPLRLVAVNASGTVKLTFRDHHVADERVLGTEPLAAHVERDAEGLRPNGSLALGVTGRCCRLLGPSSLDGKLERAREALDAATRETMPEARARAAELAMRAATTLVVEQGSSSILMDRHAQRLAREAMFLLVFASRPAIKASLRELVANGTVGAES